MKTTLPYLLLILSIGGCQTQSGEPISLYPGDDSVMLVNAANATPQAGQWYTGPTSVSANLISPTQSVIATFVKITDNCLLFDGVLSWNSLAGGSPVMFSSSLQSAEATFSGNGYSFSGLAAGPAFAANDSLVVSFPDASAATVTVTVPAPPAIADANDNLGMPAGLATQFRAPDGQFDVVTLFASATTPGAGQSGVMCEYAAADMAVEGAYRVTPLIDAATRTEITTRGWQVDMIYVAYHNQVLDTELFRGVEVPIIAGHMLNLTASEL